MTRDELIAALETATGPDAALDGEIALTQGYTFERRSGHRNEWWYTPDGRRVAFHWHDNKPPRYTESVDAAITLVPENAHHTIITQLKDGRGTAHIVMAVLDGRYEGGKRLMRCPPEPERRANPAIALCIAALKAGAVTCNT